MKMALTSYFRTGWTWAAIYLPFCEEVSKETIHSFLKVQVPCKVITPKHQTIATTSITVCILHWDSRSYFLLGSEQFALCTLNANSITEGIKKDLKAGLCFRWFKQNCCIVTRIWPLHPLFQHIYNMLGKHLYYLLEIAFTTDPLLCFGKLPSYICLSTWSKEGVRKLLKN